MELLAQLESGFKRSINWNKCQSKISIETQNQYLDYLTNASFLEVKILSFENEA